MRRHKLSPLTAAAVILLFVAVCAYLGAEIYDKISLGLETRPLKFVNQRQSIELNGIVIRREQLVCSPFPEIEHTGCGSRIPGGKAVAVSAENKDAILSESSVFYPDSDGFEYLRPEAALSLSPEALRALLAEPGKKSKACGRLVSGWDWYYAALCSARPAPELYSEYELLFPTSDSALKARLVYISPEEKGELIVLLRLTSGGEEFMHMRKTGAELVLSDFSGYRIPLNALCSDAEGNEFVYTLTAGREEKTAVEILYKMGDACIVIPSEHENALSPGSRLIVSRKN